MGEIVLSSYIEEDQKTIEVSNKFDFKFSGEIQTTITIPNFPEDFQIGLIVGSSGSGKTTLLKRCFGYKENAVFWDNNKAVISHFEDAEMGGRLLGATGLNSIPSWLKPYNVLSCGEKFRADMARILAEGKPVIDEYTSVVNRQTAKTCSYSIQKYIRNNGIKNAVFASCHDDIIDWLLPDWVYNTDTHQFYNGRYLQRPQIEINFYRIDSSGWEMFKKHHYLSGDLNKSGHCYIGEVNGQPVAFVCALAFPVGTIKHAWREHRLVVLPDYQGVGIGNSVSECIAQIYIEKGIRYFSKTSNPRCGEHRDKSPFWIPTSKNHKDRKDYIDDDGNIRGNKHYRQSDKMLLAHSKRICYSHEYIGDGTKYPYTYGQTEGQLTLFDL